MKLLRAGILQLPGPAVACAAWWTVAFACLLAALPLGAETNEVDAVEPARLSVSGFGLIGNRTLRSALRELQPDKSVATLDANFIEDAFLILHNKLLDDGYLNPTVIGNLTLTNGSEMAVWWDGHEELMVPRNVQATAVAFDVIHGVLFYYDQLKFEGLTAIPEPRARGFFVNRDVLLNLKTGRRFSDDNLHSSMRGLRRELLNLGYRDAVVQIKDQQVDPETGRSSVTIQVEQGPLYQVRSLSIRLEDTKPSVNVEPVPVPEHQPFSIAWEQDAANALTVQLYRQGYPDADTRIVVTNRDVTNGMVVLDLVAHVTAGEQVDLGEVRFVGAKHTRGSFLRRRVRLEGPLLDRVAADRGRERLARLGSFRFVDLRLEPDTGSPRDVVYELTEGRQYELSLIGGYGSYDQFFGGFEFEHFNLWGVGHNTRLKFVQSVKSTHGIYTYIIPEFLSRNLDLFASADALRREELTFDREEVKLSLGVRKQLPRSGQQVGLRYSYEFLDAQTAAVGDEAFRAAAFILDWQLDRRDNPLLPRKGYRLYANTEYANTAFGGDSQYFRLEVGASYHHSFSRGLIVHIGLLQQIVTSPDPDTLLPFNKRFFPGGENSVRGYPRGGASPLNANGDQIGAEAVLQWNLQLEQRLTRAFSVVGFLDGAGITPDIDSYPFDQVLWSIGAGLNWNTVIGPVRLEYGYNLDPRPFDPTGTLQFSIGFPF